MLSNKIHHFYDSRASIVAVIMGVHHTDLY